MDSRSKHLMFTDHIRELFDLGDVKLVDPYPLHLNDCNDDIYIDIPFDMKNLSLTDWYQPYNNGIVFYINVHYPELLRFTNAWWEGHDLHHSRVVCSKNITTLIEVTGKKLTTVKMLEKQPSYSLRKHDNTLYLLKMSSNDNHLYDFYEIDKLFVNKHIFDGYTWLDVAEHFNTLIDVSL